MLFVHFFENKNELLNQLLKSAPSVGEDVVIKGRKAKVSNVMNVEDGHVHVQVKLEAVAKAKTVEDLSKKKKR